MNRGFKVFLAMMAALVILICIIVSVNDFLSASAKKKFITKAQILLSNDHIAETTVGEFYEIHDGELVCLVSSWNVNGEMPQDHFTDYTALEALGWSVEDLPKRNALLDFIDWDFMDDWVFSINSNKRQGFIYKLWHGGSNSNNSEYGCYAPSTKIMISRDENAEIKFEMPAFDRSYEKQISELLGTKNTVQTSAIQHFGVDATYICSGLRTNKFGLHLGDFRVAGRQAIKDQLSPFRMGWNSAFFVFYSDEKEVLHIEEFDRDLVKGGWPKGCFTSDLIFEFSREKEAYHLKFPNMEEVRIRGEKATAL